ncbi:MAG: hypothetical protein ACKPHU_18115, partial [Planctomycetaceae bacterium]
MQSSAGVLVLPNLAWLSGVALILAGHWCRVSVSGIFLVSDNSGSSAMVSFFRPAIDRMAGYVPGEQPQETGW